MGVDALEVAQDVEMERARLQALDAPFAWFFGLTATYNLVRIPRSLVEGGFLLPSTVAGRRLATGSGTAVTDLYCRLSNSSA